MSQFDVHRNDGKNSSRVPYVVVVQSSRFDNRSSRIVVPLWSKEKIDTEVNMAQSGINPLFDVEGQIVMLHALQIVSVPCSALGKKVGSLRDQGDAIIYALDEVLSRAYLHHN